MEGDRVVGLTGGTGFVGGHVAKALREAGCRVRCLVRDRKSAATGPLGGLGVGFFLGDITRRESIDRTFFEGLTHIVHLVGIIRERGAQTFEAVHFEGTRNVVDLAREAGGVHRFVHMSALGTREGAASAYHRTKWKAEEYVRRSGLPYTIIRPSLIFGPEGEFVRMMTSMVRRFPVVVVPRSAPLQPVYVGDVARAFVRSLDEPTTDGAIIPVGGPDRATMGDIARVMARVMGLRRLVVELPLPLLRVPVAVMEHILPDPPVTSEQLSMLGEENTCHLEETRNHLPGFDPIGLEEGLKRCL